MTKPAEVPEWATDPGATSDPGPTRKATGFVAGKRLPAKWLNWVLSRQGAWLHYLANLHDEGEFLNKVYRWVGNHYFNWIVIDHASNEYGYATPRTRVVLRSPLTGASDIEGGWIAGGSGVLCKDVAAHWEVAIRLPQFSTLTRVRAGSSGLGATASMGVYVTACDLATGGAVGGTLIGSYDAAGAGTKILDSGTLAEVIDNQTKFYFVQFAAAELNAGVNWIELTFLDLGPRNH